MEEHDHFKGKAPLKHIVEVQSSGIATSSEVHGAETPGVLFAFLDSLRESMFLVGFFALITLFMPFSITEIGVLLGALLLGYALWRGGRSVHLAYFRLERLHRVASEEKHEIETNRTQEREELKALYQIKGFEGKLLDQVVDVLMADNERCLRVMLEEEMGFRLNENEHPIIQGAGSFLGVVVAYLLTVSIFLLLGINSVIGAALVVSAISWGVSAYKEKNRVVPALVWGASIAGACLLIAYFLLKAFLLRAA